MPSENVLSDTAIQTVFSVCASPDVAEAANAACDALPGTVFAGEFHEYFSGERRPQFSPALQAARATVAIVDCDKDPELAIVTMERMATLGLRQLSIVAFASAVDAAYLVRAMRGGCNEFLPRPAEVEPLREALRRFGNAGIAHAAGARPAGRVLTFFGAKGGVGTTTLAVHLAHNLARRHGKRTLLIDHHHELGHASLYLGLKDGQYHFDALIRNADRLDATLLQGFVVRHPSGLEVLGSPDICSLDHRSSPEEIGLVLQFLRGEYDFVLIDSSMNYKELVGPILHGSDEVILISTPDVAALRDLARRVEHLSLAADATGKLRIVLNRSTSDDAVTAAQVASVVHFPVWMSIPNNYAELVRAINAGEPVPHRNRSAFAQQFNAWADRVVAATTPAAQASGHATGQPFGQQRKRFSLWPTRRTPIAHQPA